MYVQFTGGSKKERKKERMTTETTTMTTESYGSEIPLAEATPIGQVPFSSSYGSIAIQVDNGVLLGKYITCDGNARDDDSWVSQWSGIVEEDQRPHFDPRNVVLLIACLVLTAYLALVYYATVANANGHNNSFQEKLGDGASLLPHESSSSSLSVAMQQVHHLRQELHR